MTKRYGWIPILTSEIQTKESIWNLQRSFNKKTISKFGQSTFVKNNLIISKIPIEHFLKDSYTKGTIKRTLDLKENENTYHFFTQFSEETEHEFHALISFVIPDNKIIKSICIIDFKTGELLTLAYNIKEYEFGILEFQVNYDKCKHSLETGSAFSRQLWIEIQKIYNSHLNVQDSSDSFVNTAVKADSIGDAKDMIKRKFEHHMVIYLQELNNLFNKVEQRKLAYFYFKEDMQYLITRAKVLLHYGERFANFTQINIDDNSSDQFLITMQSGNEAINQFNERLDNLNDAVQFNFQSMVFLVTALMSYASLYFLFKDNMSVTFDFWISIIFLYPLLIGLSGYFLLWSIYIISKLFSSLKKSK
jgi:hypothetical protein